MMDECGHGATTSECFCAVCEQTVYRAEWQALLRVVRAAENAILEDKDGLIDELNEIQEALEALPEHLR